MTNNLPNFIRSLPCAYCDTLERSQEAHTRKDTHTGMGEKSNDSVPLCHKCHSLQHQIGEVTFWKGHVEEVLKLSGYIRKVHGQEDAHLKASVAIDMFKTKFGFRKEYDVITAPDRFIIQKKKTLFNLVRKLLKYDASNPMEVVIKSLNKARSDAQRRLQWSWYREIGNEKGMNQNAVHNELVCKFYGELKKHPTYPLQEKEDAELSFEKNGQRFTVVSLNEYMVRYETIEPRVSTADFSTKEMSEYLDKVKYFAEQEEKIRLRIPSDYHIIKGVKLIDKERI